MAIQVWDEALQQYRGIELARYGADGTLAEALVWHDGRYRRVWPRNPNFTDDFTSPELHERWTNMGGDYTPPGLHGLLLQGPQVARDFEITVTGGRGGQIGAVSATFDQGALAALSPGEDPPYISEIGGSATFAVGAVSENAHISLRREGAEWHLLADGEIIVSAPASQSADLFVILQGVADSPITSVSYTEL